MAEISFKSKYKSGVSFTNDEYSLGNAIEDMKTHIYNVQREINFIDNSPSQAKIDISTSTIDYARALNDFSRLSFTLFIGEDFSLVASSQSGYNASIIFKKYYEGITGSIGNEINGLISFKAIDIDISFAGNNLYSAELVGDFFINIKNNNVDLFSNISEFNLDLSTGEEISYKGNLSFTSQDNSSKDYFEYLTKDSDIIYGTDFNDKINSGLGDDSIYSYGGNDIIDGSFGIDIVFINSNFNNYKISRSDNSVLLKDKRNETNNGTSVFKNIEKIQFSDILIDHDDLTGKSTLNMNKGETEKLSFIHDYDGNLHGLLGNIPSSVIDQYKYQGNLDINRDGLPEAIFTNKETGRWVTATVDSITGTIDYFNYGQGGTTRIVGVYQDPLVSAGIIIKDSIFDGSRTFLNDLKLDNLILRAADDFDGDGFQEVYWSKVDNTAYLRAVMHADGNIQYANYQNLQQMTDYLTGNGFADTVALIA